MGGGYATSLKLASATQKPSHESSPRRTLYSTTLCVNQSFYSPPSSCWASRRERRRPIRWSNPLRLLKWERKAGAPVITILRPFPGCWAINHSRGGIDGTRTHATRLRALVFSFGPLARLWGRN
jgi:hypothetical protein